MGLPEYLTMNEITDFFIEVVWFNKTDYMITKRLFSCRNNLHEIHAQAHSLYQTIEGREGYALYVALPSSGGKLIYTDFQPHWLAWYYEASNLQKTN